MFACLDLKRRVSRLLDRCVTCLIEGGEDGHLLFASLELKQSVYYLLDRSAEQQLLFGCSEFKRSVSRLLDGSVSCFIEGSEHRHTCSLVWI